MGCPDAKATHLTSHHQENSCRGERPQHSSTGHRRARAPGRNSPTPPHRVRVPRAPVHPLPPPPPPPTTVSAAPTSRPTSAMRIRRYAARLLSSTSPGSATTAAPSSPPRPLAASWLHTDDDDCCAFCELSRPAPQVTRSPSPPPSSIAALFARVAMKGGAFTSFGAGVVTVGVCPGIAGGPGRHQAQRAHCRLGAGIPCQGR